MIDPGHPFSVPIEDIAAALEDRLRFGVEQPAAQVFIYRNDVATYELGRLAEAITRVSGLTADGSFAVFEPSLDYRFSNNRIIWQPDGRRPQQGVRFTVDYVFREPAAGITDFNPGSVAGTILRSVASEIKLLYEQMDQAYRRAFIEVATDVALDNVVALLGVTRTPAQPARGVVRFSVRQPAATGVTIAAGTRVADEGGRTFATLPVSETESDAVLPAGEVSVDVPVEALTPGPTGNVNPDTITIMPTPPPGIDGVTNPDVTEGGREAETDDNLRERAKSALEQAGKATLDAIRFAVLEVPGVDDVQVLDHSVDATIPIGEVQVRHSGTADPDAVSEAVASTRAAGILARLAEVNEVLIGGMVYAIPEPSSAPDAAAALEEAIEAHVGALKIGEPLFVARMNATVYTIAGLADVAEAQLTFTHLQDPNAPGSFLDGDITSDPFFVGNAEQLQLAAPAPSVALVRALTATPVGSTGGGFEFNLTLQDETEADISFRDFTLDVTGVLTGFLQSNDQPETIGTFALQANFTGASTATVTLMTGGFDAARHKPEAEAHFSAPAYPGIATDDARVTITL